MSTFDIDNVTDLNQDNWRNQQNYKETTPPQDRLDSGGNQQPKQRSLEYIRSQQDNTYYTDGSSDGKRVAAEVVHKEEEIIIRLNDSASVLDAEMSAIRVALENASETRDKITIHTYSLTAINILKNRKQDFLNTIMRAITQNANY